MSKKDKDRKYGFIPQWIPWEPHGHSRNRSARGRRRSGSCCIGGGGEGICGRCGPCGICIIILLFIIIFGGLFPFGGLDDGVDVPDDDETRYYQLKLRVEEEPIFLAAGYIPAVEGFEFDVDIERTDGFGIEHTTLVYDETYSSIFDYISAYGLNVYIYNDDMGYAGEGLVHSGDASTINIYHFGEIVAVAHVSWLLDGSGIRW